jgi:hypothetical protein
MVRGKDRDPNKAPREYDPEVLKDRDYDGAPDLNPADRAGKKASKKTVRDTKRGKAANDYQVPVGGDDDDGANEKFIPDGKTLSEAISAIMGEKATIKSIMDAARKKCQGPRGSITKVRKSMIKSGYAAKVLDAQIREEVLKQKIKDNRGNLDEGEVVSFDAFKAARDKYAGSVFGDAARENVH